MKKIVVILMILFVTYAASSAYAESLTREYAAELLSEIIWNGKDEEKIFIKDMENPSQSVMAAVSADIMRLDNENCFNPGEKVFEYDFIESLVKAFEIRMGTLEPAALGGYTDGYSSLSHTEKRYTDKAVMLGIVPDDNAVRKDRYIEFDNASLYKEKVLNAIEIMKVHGIGEVITGFRNEDAITGTPNGKITFYASINSKPEYNSAVLVMALYGDGKLVDVSYKSYQNLDNNDFTVMHTCLEVPEIEGDIRVKAFIFDSLNSLKPIYEYKLIR